MSTGETIVERLGDIPVVNDGWTSAMDYYGRLKDYNSLTKFTLNVAESSVKKAAEISTPVVGQYKTQINSVNNYACNKLDELETKYPLIKQPSGEVKDACLEYADPVVSKVKPVVHCVQNVMETGKKQVISIKETSTRLVTGACDIGVGTVTGVVSMSLATPPGRLLTRTVDGALNIADGLVDKYIPEEAEEKDSEGEKTIEGEDSPAEVVDKDTLENVPQMEEMEATPERVVVHFQSVSNKIRRRMFRKAMKDYQGAKVRAFDALGKLKNHVNLIDYARTNFDQAKGKANDIWDKIKDDQIEDGENAVQAQDAGMLEEKIIRLGRVLMQQVKSGVETMESISQETGLLIKNPVSKSREYRDLFIQFSSTHSLADMSIAALANIRANLKVVSQNLRSMVDDFKVPEWISQSINVDVQDLDLDEEDVVINASLRDAEEPEVIGNHVA